MTKSSNAKCSSRLVAILEGGDWYDASVDHLVVPEALDVEQAQRDYDKWYREEYCPSLKADMRLECMSFTDWLITRCGSRHSTDDELLVVDRI